MQGNKILAYLGLATRAGRVVSGEFCVEKSVRQRRAKLVIVSEDASEASKKKFRNICTYYKVPLYFFGNREELGAACGKELRVSAAIEDEGLAHAAIRQLEQETGIGGSKYVE
ncbi:MAG: ribosomal L7Ae/L30e/S12e/Gadd45 family protein [Clostridiales bacterium]|nr:ribosomal L7Ae/L30e/S12e/Gadd45 family protein [Clostridiales bacterium]